jgi:hypothetical protein
VSIQLKLNTEERAMIWMAEFLFICIRLPIKEVIKINGNIVIFVWNVMRYAGASFCHVINVVEAFHSMLSTILVNHCWNGEHAIFTIRVIVESSIIVRSAVSLFFVIITLMIRILEEIDWITKYFILLSAIFFFLILLPFMIEQKAKVFISNMIQMDSHEFIIKQQVLEVSNIGTKIMFILSLVRLQI